MTKALQIAAGVLTVAVLSGLGGCVQFHDQPLSIEGARADLDRRSLADAGLHAFIEKYSQPSAATPSWDLAKLSLAAFYFHPDLDIARAQLASVDAAGLTAGERPNPTLNFTPGYNTTTGPPWILGMSFDIPVETAGKRGYRLAQAAHLSQAARYQLATSAWKVRSRVRQTLLALYAASEGQTLLRAQERVQVESADLLAAQLQLGAVTPFELTQSRIALNQTRFAMHDADQAIATARLRLADSLGVAPTALDAVNLDFDAFKEFPFEIPGAAARRQALDNRADLLGALAEYAAAQSALQLEIAKQYPDIHLGPGYQRDQGNDKWSIGITAALPLFNRNRGSIAESEARRAAAAVKFEALQARVLSEIDQAIAGYRASVEKVTAAQSLNAELRAQLQTAQGMLELGEISRPELAQRKLELTNAALAQLDALIKTQSSLGALEDALQSPAAIVAVSESSPRSATTSPTLRLPVVPRVP